MASLELEWKLTLYTQGNTEHTALRNKELIKADVNRSLKEGKSATTPLHLYLFSVQLFYSIHTRTNQNIDLHPLSSLFYQPQ